MCQFVTIDFVLFNYASITAFNFQILKSPNFFVRGPRNLLHNSSRDGHLT